MDKKGRDQRPGTLANPKKNRHGGRSTNRQPRLRPNAEYRGRKFDPGNNPPDVTLSPFNHLVLVHLAEGSAFSSFKVKDLLTQLKSQVDPDSRQNLEVGFMELKIQSVRVWNLTGKMLTLRANDFVTSTTDAVVTLCTTMDVCGGADWARVAFEWPTTHKQVTLSSSRDVSLFDVVTGANDKAIMYVTVLWRFTGQPVIKFSGDILVNMSRNINSIRQTSQKLVTGQEESNRHLTEIVKNQPGLVSKIIDGITHVGAYVAPLAADAELLSRLDELKMAIDDLALVSQYDSGT